MADYGCTGLDNLTDQEFKKQAEVNMLYC